MPAFKSRQPSHLSRDITYQLTPRFTRLRVCDRIRGPVYDSSFSASAPQYHLPSLVQRHHLRTRNVSSSHSTSSLLARYLTSASHQRTFKDLRPCHTREPYRTQATNTIHLQSAFGTYTLAAIVVVGGFIYSLTGEKRKSDLSDLEKQLLPELVDDVEEQIRKMSGETLPGRPGALTPEEDEKLRQFWVATMQVLGIVEPKEANGTTEVEPVAASVRSDTASSKKADPKKKRMSMFRRNKEDKTEAPLPPATAVHSDQEDKYGQTKEFHDALANLSPETLRVHFWAMMKQDNPDAFLLRFLRARKWDVEKALVMMVSTIRWRAMDVHLDDDVMLNGEMGSLEDSNSTDPAKKKFGTDFLTQMRLGKSFLHGLDKMGRPMCFVRVRFHKAGEQSEESMERYTVFVIESARLLLNPPVDTACVVFDMTGFSLANMDYAPVKFMIKCFEANYPESLGVVLVHKAPWIFQGIWKIIRGWLDPVVASKIQFTSDHAAMEEFVESSRIPTELGGGEKWEYKYIEPVAGENDIMKDTVTRDKIQVEREAIFKEYEKHTLTWIHATGDVAAAKLRRAELVVDLHDNYWRLDPYVRARTYYDRCGMINPGGSIKFYPDAAAAAAAPPVAVVAPAPVTNGTPKPVETSEADLD